MAGFPNPTFWVLRMPTAQFTYFATCFRGLEEVLAAELRVRNETLSRAFNRMRSLGLIDARGRTIRVEDPLKLEALMQSAGRHGD